MQIVKQSDILWRKIILGGLVQNTHQAVWQIFWHQIWWWQQHLIFFLTLKNIVLGILKVYMDSVNKTEIIILDKEVDLNVKNKHQLGNNIRKIFYLFMVQFTKSLKGKLRCLSTVQVIKGNTNSVWFLHTIKEVAFKFEVHENIYVSLWNINKRTANTYQNHSDLVQYLGKVKVQDSISLQIHARIWYDLVMTEVNLKDLEK